MSTANHTLVLAPDACAPGALRRRLAQVLGGGIHDDALARLQVVCSALVSNATLHGDGPLTVAIEHDPERIRVSVVHRGDPTRALRLDGTKTVGPSVQIVNRRACRWGVREGTSQVRCV